MDTETLAEVRSNLTGDPYEVSLTEVMAMQADGAVYDIETGWTW